MGGPVGGVNVPNSMPNVAQTNEDLVLDGLQAPVQQRFENMGEMFQNLTPGDAKTLFDRLSQPNSKDVLSTQFQKTFQGKEAEQLLKILSGKFQTTADVPKVAQDPAQKADPKGGSALRNELALHGNILQAQIQGQLPAGIADVTKGAEKILDNSRLKPEQKMAELQKFLEGKNLSGEDIKQLLSNMSGRKADDQELIASAIGKSSKLMETIGKDLPEGDQLKVMNQIFQSIDRLDKGVIKDEAWQKRQQDVDKNLGKWAQRLSPETLNRVFDEKSSLGTALRGIADDASIGSKFMNKLSDEHKSDIINARLRVSPVNEEDAHYIGALFKGLSPAAKNKLFDTIQDNGDMPKFLASQAKFFSAGHLEGLNRENIQFIQSTFEQLAKAAEMKKDTNAVILYQEKILHVKGYMENHFR